MKCQIWCNWRASEQFFDEFRPKCVAHCCVFIYETTVEPFSTIYRPVCYTLTFVNERMWGASITVTVKMSHQDPKNHLFEFFCLVTVWDIFSSSLSVLKLHHIPLFDLLSVYFLSFADFSCVVYSFFVFNFSLICLVSCLSSDSPQ